MDINFELTGIINDYCSLIGQRPGDNVLKTSDEVVIINLIKIFSEQRVDIEKIRSQINATKINGLTEIGVKKLANLKAKIDELADSRAAPTQKALDMAAVSISQSKKQTVLDSHLSSSSTQRAEEVYFDETVKMPLVVLEDLEFSSTKKEAKPTFRVDEIFDALSAVFPKELIKTVEVYDQDTINEIIDALEDNKKEFPDFAKEVAESMTVLDLRLYPKLIKNISKIFETFKNIEILYMPKSTQENDLKALESLKKLRELNLIECDKIKNISSLANLKSLKSLNLELCSEIKDISPLVSLTDLQFLSLAHCKKITDIRPLAKLLALQSLNLFQCDGITDISSLSSLVKLQFLNISFCSKIINFSPLANLTKLQTLNLGFCSRIIDLCPLSGLTDLQSLYLHCCRGITDISPLANLLKLQFLNITSCPKIVDTSPLSNLKCEIKR